MGRGVASRSSKREKKENKKKKIYFFRNMARLPLLRMFCLAHPYRPMSCTAPKLFWDDVTRRRLVFLEPSSQTPVLILYRAFFPPPLIIPPISHPCLCSIPAKVVLLVQPHLHGRQNQRLANGRFRCLAERSEMWVCRQGPLVSHAQSRAELYSSLLCIFSFQLSYFFASAYAYRDSRCRAFKSQALSLLAEYLSFLFFFPSFFKTSF